MKIIDKFPVGNMNVETVLLNVTPAFSAVWTNWEIAQDESTKKKVNFITEKYLTDVT